MPSIGVGAGVGVGIGVGEGLGEAVGLPEMPALGVGWAGVGLGFGVGVAFPQAAATNAATTTMLASRDAVSLAISVPLGRAPVRLDSGYIGRTGTLTTGAG